VSTPRKRWFALECSVYREPWSREQKLTLAMLGMHMMDRWASDLLTPEQACVVRLQPGDLLTITGADSVEVGLDLLRALSRVVSLRVRALDSGFIRVEWPKFAETQQLGIRTPGGKRPNAGQSPPGDRPVTAPPILSSPNLLLSSTNEKNTHIQGEPEKPAAAGASPKRSESQPPLDPSAPHVKFALDFTTALRSVHGDAVNPPAFDAAAFRRWAAQARLLIDAVGEPCTRKVANWLFRGTDDDATFWRAQVLSVPKFRQRFPTLRMQSETNARAGPRSVRGSGAEEALAALGKRFGMEVTTG
jgi:hypothetical protein